MPQSYHLPATVFNAHRATVSSLRGESHFSEVRAAATLTSDIPIDQAGSIAPRKFERATFQREEFRLLNGNGSLDSRTMITIGSIPFVLLMLINSYVILVQARVPIYWQLRQRLLADEKRRFLGGDMELGPVEVEANKVLMEAKSRELADGSILSFIIAWPVRARSIRATYNRGQI